MFPPNTYTTIQYKDTFLDVQSHYGSSLKGVLASISLNLVSYKQTNKYRGGGVQKVMKKLTCFMDDPYIVRLDWGGDNVVDKA